MNETEIFRPGIAEMRKLADRLKGLDIKGIDDEAGYLAVKAGKKELADMRILVTKAGKMFREEAIARQKEVLRQEREHLDIIVPLENELKEKMLAVDEARKKEERRILLPARLKMLEDLNVTMTEDEILSMDESMFSTFFQEKKLATLEAEDLKRRDAEATKRREEELEKARKEAAERATREAEEKIAREKAEEERRARERAENEKADEERREKNRRYKAWLKKNGIENGHDDTELKIDRVGDTFTLWRKVDEIIIK